MIWASLFWLSCGVITVTVGLRSIYLALQRQRLVYQMPAYDHGVEVAATSRVRLHTILTLMGFAVLIVGIISAIPHPSSAIENLLVIGLFLFIALCLAIVTILLSLAEGGIRADRGRK